MNTNRLLLTVIALILILGGVGWYLASSGMLPGLKNNAGAPSDLHAVFLTNGQVYFGKLSDPNNQLVTLNDIYYLQVKTEQQEQKDAKEPQISLVKLGEELHGPVDEMKINRDHILFFEKMKSNAKVVEAIEQYRKNGPQTPAPATTSTASPAGQ